MSRQLGIQTPHEIMFYLKNLEGTRSCNQPITTRRKLLENQQQEVYIQFFLASLHHPDSSLSNVTIPDKDGGVLCVRAKAWAQSPVLGQHSNYVYSLLYLFAF